MSNSSISCCLGLPAPARSGSTRLQPSSAASTTAAPWSGGLRRACVGAAAAACIAIGAAGGGDAALARDAAPVSMADVAVAVDARPAPRWSDRRQCSPWRANSLENIVPENLPRPSARRRFNNVTAPEKTPALAPEAVAPFLALHSGMGCFSL